MWPSYSLDVWRVVILGPGASGKSTLANQFSEIVGLPVIELDKVFWRPGVAATPRDQWSRCRSGLSRRIDGYSIVTWGRMMLSKFGFMLRIRSFSWTFRSSDVLVAVA
jgi:hypothetical protein